jgi:hypothetical protein
MRTTLDIEDDVLAAARELARRQGTTAGQMVSRLLRAALSGAPSPGQIPAVAPTTVAGFRPFQSKTGAVVTNDLIDQLRDEAGV